MILLPNFSLHLSFSIVVDNTESSVCNYLHPEQLLFYKIRPNFSVVFLYGLFFHAFDYVLFPHHRYHRCDFKIPLVIKKGETLSVINLSRGD